MRRLWLIPLLAAVVAACQCYQPVDDCTLSSCDGGVDAGVDAGTEFDAGVVTCDVWDGGVGLCAAITGWLFEGDRCRGACVEQPIQTPGIHWTLASCTRCGCVTGKLVGSAPNTPFSPNAWCDAVVVVTNQSYWMEQTFPELQDGGCAAPGPNGVSACQLSYAGYLNDGGFERACQATLVPGVSQVQCRVYLP